MFSIEDTPEGLFREGNPGLCRNVESNESLMYHTTFISESIELRMWVS